jgi:predicted Rossmann-fold nucleotide-binding protein
MIFILNSEGFYDHLIAHIEKMKAENFLYEEAVKRVVIIKQPEEIVPFFNTQ